MKINKRFSFSKTMINLEKSPLKLNQVSIFKKLNDVLLDKLLNERRLEVQI